MTVTVQNVERNTIPRIDLVGYLKLEGRTTMVNAAGKGRPRVKVIGDELEREGEEIEVRGEDSGGTGIARKLEFDAAFLQPLYQ